MKFLWLKFIGKIQANQYHVLYIYIYKYIYKLKSVVTWGNKCNISFKIIVGLKYLI